MVKFGRRYLMKIPKNLTKEETINKINSVIAKIAPRYTFSGYDIDDIKQEAFIICIDALDRYDQKRPLENFLSVHLSNRLKNFVRDNFCTSKNDNDKKKVLMPTSINADHSIYDDVDSPELLSTISEIKEKIDLHLPASMRMDYLRMINGAYVVKKRKEEIVQFIKQLISDNK